MYNTLIIIQHAGHMSKFFYRNDQMDQVMRKHVMPYTNNKGADQPVQPRSLISTFVVRCLGSMIYILAVSKVSRF